jgi:hypothetical protein
MEVETFEIEELTSDMTTEEDGTAMAMIDRLGLEGQKKLCGGADQKSVCPYRKLTKEEARVYKLLFPQDVGVKAYSDGRIPIRVMQVIEHARSLKMFDFIRVWCPENADEPDPLLVGYVGEYDFSPKERYILARWGECLAPFSELRRKAAEKFRTAYLAACKKEMSAIRHAADAAAEMTADEWFETHGGTDLPIANHL